MAKKRHHEEDNGTHEHPRKKIATSPTVLGGNTDKSISPEKGSFNPSQSSVITGNLEKKSGYRSVGLLEETLAKSSQVHVPSSLPPQASRSQGKQNIGSGQFYGSFPALPLIKNPNIAEAPFTHQGTMSDLSSGGELISMNYERLEFLGDAYLELIASRAILPRFPDFSPGKLSQTRQLITCNETLAEFSLRYGFDKRAHLPPELKRRQGASEDRGWTKTMGDIFEAYLAAVIISDAENGFAIAEKWLAELWEPLLSSQVNPQVADAKTKQVLATKIMSKGTKINYRDHGLPKNSNLKGKSVFSVGIYYTGLGYTDLFLGSGQGSNKAEAGYDAASKALKHPQLKEIMAKKKEFDARSRAEKEQRLAAEKSTED
ncbi:MAG: hypothetical protein Q9201_002781 [Fulgogasparrea decipioides]